jgi:hypothetical protein
MYEIPRACDENFGEMQVLSLKREELNPVAVLINISLCGESKWTKAADVYFRATID